jgi:Tfp pilus assembly protein PilZ
MLGGTMVDERRRFPRKQVSHSTNILSVETQGVLGECFLTNVSESGFAIESDCRFSLGHKIFIKINMLNDVISLIGEVVRVDKGFFDPLYGVRISENESGNLDIFRSYINHQLN